MIVSYKIELNILSYLPATSTISAMFTDCKFSGSHSSFITLKAAHFIPDWFATITSDRYSYLPII